MARALMVDDAMDVPEIVAEILGARDHQVRIGHDGCEGEERIPVVLTSGVMALADVAARVGTPHHLGKPFQLAALLESLDRALEERTAPQPVWR